MPALLAILLVACKTPADTSTTPADTARDSRPGDTDSGDTGDTTPPIWGPGLVQGGTVACAEPALRDLHGPMVRTTDGDWGTIPTMKEGFTSGSGVAIEDFSGDGLLDIILPGGTGCLLFLGQPDGGLLAGEAPPGCAGFGLSHADVDGDGDLDLLVASRETLDQLFINDGTGHFTEEGAARGVQEPGGLVQPDAGMSLHDIDGDGDLDLFISGHRSPALGSPSNGGAPNRLLLNDGAGYFTDVSDRLTEEQRRGITFIGAWIDVDMDNAAELYLVNDFGALAVGNALLDVDSAGYLSPMDASTGLNLVMDGRGLGVGDINRDGLPDLALSDWGTFRLMLSAAPGIWYDGALASGISVDRKERVTSWGVEVFDIDNDGDLDIHTAFGSFYGQSSLSEYAYNPESQPDALWLQGEDGRFTEAAAAWGLDDRTRGRAVVAADLNQDGWLDLVKTDYIDGPARVYYSRCGDAAWLSVRLQGRAPNTAGVGARIDAWVDGTRHMRWILAGSASMTAGAPLEAHFGLGDADTVDRLEVTWPDGTTSRFTQLPTRQRLWITQP